MSRPKPVLKEPASSVAALPANWRLLISAALLWHVSAVIVAPLSVGPASMLEEGLFTIYRPYLEACYLNHGYHFFGPEPGPSTLVRYEIELPDGQRIDGVFPDLKQHRPRLLYHRHFMLSERLAGDPETPWIKAFADSYARHLFQLHHAKSVTLYQRTHELSIPQQILEGRRLDDPGTYHERKLLTYTGDAP